MPSLFDSKRSFFVWKYEPMHRQLTLRSAPDESNRTRLDVGFASVWMISLRTQFDGLTICEGVAPMEISVPYQRKTYRVRSASGEGWIIAGGFDWHEDEEPGDAPSFWDDPRRFVRSR